MAPRARSSGTSSAAGAGLLPSLPASTQWSISASCAARSRAISLRSSAASRLGRRRPRISELVDRLLGRLQVFLGPLHRRDRARQRGFCGRQILGAISRSIPESFRLTSRHHVFLLGDEKQKENI
jgi:hypothetical protein